MAKKRNRISPEESAGENHTAGEIQAQEARSGFSEEFEWGSVTEPEEFVPPSREQKEIPAETAGGENRGVSLRIASLIFAVAAVLLSAALFLTDTLVSSGYQRSVEADDRYHSAIQAAVDLEAGSDYLTDRVRCYAVTGEREYMDDYFEEVHVTRRRDNALSTLEVLLDGSINSAYDSLSAALGYSNELMEREYLAMRLTAEALNAGDTDLPGEIIALTLPGEYASLSAAAMREKAQELVYDGTYMEYKDLIRKNVNLCTENLIAETSDLADEAAVHLRHMRTLQTALILALLCAVLLAVIFIHLRVTRPLSDMVRHMRQDSTVPSSGVSELRFVTETYNEILEENHRVRRHLTYEASHDALTGLYNRSAYEMFTQSIDQDHIALLLVDVDKFKTFNDQYGHDVGDRVLIRVADTLKRNFRSVDIVCRIGGDEFVIIMRRVDSSMADLIVEKVDYVNGLLNNPEDDLPPISLSVGIAFSDRPNPVGDIFKDADTALYRVKENGRNGCAVFS